MAQQRTSSPQNTSLLNFVLILARLFSSGTIPSIPSARGPQQVSRVPLKSYIPQPSVRGMPTAVSTPMVGKIPQATIPQPRPTLPSQKLPTKTSVNLSKILKEKLPSILPTSVSTPAFIPPKTPPQKTKAQTPPPLKVETPTPTTTTSPQPTTGTAVTTTTPSVQTTPSVPVLTPQGQEIFQQMVGDYAKSGGFIQTNVPEGAQTFVFKDPLGGSTPIFGHIIQPGETLSKIARQYGVSIDELLRINEQNKKAVKSRDLIIAGETLYVPVKTKEVKPQIIEQKTLLQQTTPEDVNRVAEERMKAGKKPSLPEEVVVSRIQQMLEPVLGPLQEYQQRLEQVFHPNFYVEQFENYRRQLGLEGLYQQRADLWTDMEKTREDILKEAAQSGGLVTQSQVEEILAFRQGILKDRLIALNNMIESREKLLDHYMQYVRYDREELRKYFDQQFDIASKVSQFTTQAMKEGYDYMKDLIKYNREKLIRYVKDGELLRLSPEFLYEFTDPSSFSYAGVTLEELTATMRVAQVLEEERRIKREKELQQMRINWERFQLSIEREARIKRHQEEQRRMQRERLELQKQKGKGKSIGKNIINKIP